MISYCFRTLDEVKETRAQKKAKKLTARRDADKDEDEGEWEEVTAKGGAPLVVVRRMLLSGLIGLKFACLSL